MNSVALFLLRTVGGREDVAFWLLDALATAVIRGHWEQLSHIATAGDGAVTIRCAHVCGCGMASWDRNGRFPSKSCVSNIAVCSSFLPLRFSVRRQGRREEGPPNQRRHERAIDQPRSVYMAGHLCPTLICVRYPPLLFLFVLIFSLFLLFFFFHLQGAA